MKENEIPAGANRKKRCIGRGEGNGHGKTSGRGHKGAGARSGYSLRAGFEGGQMPMQKRLPKYGFTSRISRVTAQVRTSELAAVIDGVIDLDALKRADLVGTHIERAKVFLSGDVTKAFTIQGLAVTKGAREAIEKAGGKVEE